MSILNLKTPTPTLNFIFYLLTQTVKYSFQELKCILNWFKVCQIHDLKYLFQGLKCQIQALKLSTSKLQATPMSGRTLARMRSSYGRFADKLNNFRR